MTRGKYPRLTINRDLIFKLTGQRIPLTRTRKDGSEYVVTVTPRCIDCKGKPVHKLYKINRHYRKIGIPRNEHRGYECPKCNTMFPIKIVEKKVEIFTGDR